MNSLCRSGSWGEGVIVFFAFSDGYSRAEVQTLRAPTLEEIWSKAGRQLSRWMMKNRKTIQWLRVEAVCEVQELSWWQFKGLLARTKRNYFQYGISLDANFSTAMLEHELHANAVLYHHKSSSAIPNPKNLQAYSRRKYKRAVHWPSRGSQLIWCFKTRGVFADLDGAWIIQHDGPNAGSRIREPLDISNTEFFIEKCSKYLARQVKESGEYHYGWFPCFDRAIGTYNALRHASSTYSLLEAWESNQDQTLLFAAQRALKFLATDLTRRMALPDGSDAAFVVDLGNQIKLGANAAAILAFVKHAQLTGDGRYQQLMNELARGVLYMQQPDTGKFVHVLNYPDLGLKDEFRIIYYDGEATFALTRLYGLTKNERWLNAAEAAFEYFIATDHWRHHDHWLAYCANELTLYKQDPRYYKFGLDNVRNHLDFVLNRLTTYPTLLEHMMATQQMIARMQSQGEAVHLLDGFDLVKFYQAIKHRANYLINGFFFPEIAMFYKNPGRILNGFFIRHHAFRVRIDDVEHYLSGLIAYRKYLSDTRIPF